MSEFDFEAADREVSAPSRALFEDALKDYEDGKFTEFVIVGHGLNCRTCMWISGDVVNGSMYAHVGALEHIQQIILREHCEEDAEEES